MRAAAFVVFFMVFFGSAEGRRRRGGGFRVSSVRRLARSAVVNSPTGVVVRQAQKRYRKQIRRGLRQAKALRRVTKSIRKNISRRMRALPKRVRKSVKKATRRIGRLSKMVMKYAKNTKELVQVTRMVLRAVLNTLIPALKGARLAAFAMAMAQTIRFAGVAMRTGQKIGKGLKGDGLTVMNYFDLSAVSDAEGVDKAVDKMFELWIKDPTASLIGIKDTVAPFANAFKQIIGVVVKGFKSAQSLVRKVAEVCQKVNAVRSRVSTLDGAVEEEATAAPVGIKDQCNAARSKFDLPKLASSMQNLLVKSLQAEFDKRAQEFIKSMTKRMAIAAITGT